MALVISVSGKGGVGKTVVTALLLKLMIGRGSILAVDADPATNLPDVLGVRVEKTVGAVVDELKRRVQRGDLASTISKEGVLEAWIYEVLVEADGFDLLAMGRTEGEGCYCSVNYMLAKIVDSLSRNYDYTLMDMEAGLEHLSRRTDRSVDLMLIVTDPSKMGLETARRIRELAEEVHIEVKRIALIGNNFPQGLNKRIEEEASQLGLELVGSIPPDPSIMEYNIQGKPLLELPMDSPSLKALKLIAEKLGII
ncbi:MAG: AAA family ATPase [Candidatus Bathyarchaeia archaeon]|nr:AAA family ATPase [Candidatus Bathyarchaeota archaeon]